MPATLATRIHASLLGGAIGDALGAPIEFDSLATIRARFGPAGLTDFAPAYGLTGAITDDTQMTLFTAEGVVRAYVRQRSRGMCHPASVVHHAYLRWLLTQGYTPRASVAQPTEYQPWPDGWLVNEPRLFSQRAPGNTCLSALVATDDLGARARNDSKGCGTLMRTAPIGLALEAEAAFTLGKEASAVTHGHPTGILTGGAFAFLVARLLEGAPLAEAVGGMRARVASEAHAGETLAAIDAAVALAARTAGHAPIAEDVQALGEGWVAEEALGIAVYCALVARSFEHGVLLAVNHGGDCDSTGSLVGRAVARGRGARGRDRDRGRQPGRRAGGNVRRGGERGAVSGVVRGQPSGLTEAHTGRTVGIGLSDTVQPLATIEAFDRHLARLGLGFEGVVVGGSALFLLGVVRRPTRDFDILVPEVPTAVLAAARDFARLQRAGGHDLLDEWLNNGPSQLADALPPGWRDRVERAFVGEAVRLDTLGRLDLLRTKLFALCDRGTDLGDCLALAPTPDELSACAPWLAQQDANELWPEHVRATLADLAGRLDHGL